MYRYFLPIDLKHCTRPLQMRQHAHMLHCLHRIHKPMAPSVMVSMYRNYRNALQSSRMNIVLVLVENGNKLGPVRKLLRLPEYFCCSGKNLWSRQPDVKKVAGNKNQVGILALFNSLRQRIEAVLSSLLSIGIAAMGIRKNRNFHALDLQQKDLTLSVNLP